MGYVLSTDRPEVHHIKPLAQGGDKYELSNLTTLCHDCDVAVRGRSTIVDQTSSHPSPVIREIHAQHETKKRKIENGIAGPDNAWSRWWAELTYMGHATLSLTLARSKAGSERLPLSPEEGRIPRIALSVVCATLRPRDVGFTTPEALVADGP